MKGDTALAHWSNAVEGLESAEILHNHGKYKRAISEAYYTMEAAARASLATKEVHPKTRTGVWRALTNKMVHSGEMAAKTADHLVNTGVPQNFKLGRLETSVSDRMTLLQVVQKTGDPSRGP